MFRADASESNEYLALAAGGSRSEKTQKEAFEELFRRLRRASVEWARLAGGDCHGLAEDAANLAWARAWRYRHRFDPLRGAYATWLKAIVHNETMDLQACESRHRHSEWTEEQGERPAEGSFEDARLPDLHFVWEVFENLKAARPEFADGLTLKSFGYRDKEIAEHLGLQKVGTVGSRLFRAKRLIAEGLAERGVVFVPGCAGLGPMQGLIQLCRTGDGAFYGLPAGGDLELLPLGQRPQGPSTLILEGFFVAVWRPAAREGAA